LSLTIQFMMAPTHTINGLNYADIWHAALTWIGILLILSGVATVIYTGFALKRHTALEMK
jgi:formate-dependent nitrite reductase membrane component NrfD